MNALQAKVDALDISLFQYVTSQSTDNDRRSFLALQSAMGQRSPYVYLEIGSYRGGSIQPYLVDDRCRRVISIDPRPYSLPDERGASLSYKENTTQAMLDELKNVAGGDMAKIQTIEQGTDTLTPDKITVKPDLCFVDGEHTDTAVIRDARFCLSVLNANGCMFFHDVNIVFDGVMQFLEELKKSGRKFRTLFLPDVLIMVEFDDCRISQAPQVQEMLRRNSEGYLHSLKVNSYYRDYYNRPILKLFRQIRYKTWDPVTRVFRKPARP